MTKIGYNTILIYYNYKEGAREMNYNNEICNGCGRKFSEGDDIVTCPECGTPQHRECWLKEHKCVNEHLHEEGFEWKPKHSSEEKNEEIKSVRKRPCPFCGHENPVDAKECENCSQPFEMFGRSIFPSETDEQGQQNAFSENSGEYSYKPPFKVDYEEPKDEGDKFNPFEQGAQTDGQPVGQAFIFNSAAYEPEVLGVETKDFAAYVRASVPSYYKKFKKFEHGKKVTFNFAALFFGPLWFFFRKLYKAGIVFLSLTLCITMAFYSPLSDIMDSYTEIVNEINDMRAAENQPSEEEMQAIVNEMYAFAQKNGPAIYAYVGATTAVYIACALFADMLYKKKFLKDIEAAKEEAQGVNEQKYLLILRKGGVTFFAPAAAYFIMQAIVSLLVRMFF